MLNLLSTIDGSDPPLTQGQRQRYADLSEEWESYKKKLNQIMNNEISEFNRLYKKEDLPAVIIPE
jgi:glutamate synthase domain-containing protein 3